MNWATVALATILPAMLLTSCSNDPVAEDTFLSLSIISGNHQDGFQTQELADPLVIQVTDDEGGPVSDLQLAVSITEGDGAVLNPELKTDMDGRLAIEWEMGLAYDHALKVSIAGDNARSVTATAIAQYLYEVPSEISDGWETRSLDTGASQTASLFAAVDSIRSGHYPEVHSMLVVKDGDLVLETYFPGRDSQGNFIEFDRSTPHEVQSASKSFRSAMIGIAIDQGFIPDVDMTLFSAFPEHASLSGSKEGITLEHVLTMSTGLDWDESGAAAGGTDNTLSQMYSLPATQWAGYVLGRPVAYEPGSRFVYNTGASILLNQIVMNKSGTAMDIFVRRFYSNLVESSVVPGIGYPLAASIRPRDMAKLGQVYLDDGRWKDEQVVSEEWVRRSCEKQFQVSSAEGYGYQWWLRSFRVAGASYDSCYAAGNGGQFIFVVDDLDLVIVFTGGNFGSATMNQVFGMIERQVLPAFL